MASTGRAYIRSPFFLLVDCIMRWISRKLVSRRSCPSLNSNVHACVHAHARPRPHSRLRDSNKGARTRRCNLMDERIHGGTAGQQVARWTGIALPWDVRSRTISSFSRSQAYRLSRKKKKLLLFVPHVFIQPCLLTKYLKIVRPFVRNGNMAECQVELLDAISLKIEIIYLPIKSWTVNSEAVF